MKKLLITILLLNACTADNGSNTDSGEPQQQVESLTVSSSNTCDSAYNFNGNVLVVETAGEIWLSYTGQTDLLQVDTCDSGQAGTFEVYHNCEWYDSGRGTINGRNDQKVKDCYTGFYGDVKGIRQVDVKIRIIPASDLSLPYNVNFNEVGY